MKPSVGRIVHYMSYGSKGGEFTPECRAAVVAELVSETHTALVVMNPTGLFFNTCEQDEDAKAGGTWHWPERVY
jgi:hypothetical protein